MHSSQINLSKIIIKISIKEIQLLTDFKEILFGFLAKQS